MAMEMPQATWDKRFKARHYIYRDHHVAATGAAPAAYVFGANARLVSKWNWPTLGDWRGARPCYAREVKVLCSEDCYVMFVSLNPVYLKLIGQGYTAQQIAAGLTPHGEAVPATITEVPQFLPFDEQITWYPTYGVSIVFYQSTAAGTIYVWAEGNVEGGE